MLRCAPHEEASVATPEDALTTSVPPATRQADRFHDDEQGGARAVPVQHRLCGAAAVEGDDDGDARDGVVDGVTVLDGVMVGVEEEALAPDVGWVGHASTVSTRRVTPETLHSDRDAAQEPEAEGNVCEWGMCAR